MKNERQANMVIFEGDMRPTFCRCEQGRAGPCWCALSQIEPPPERERKAPLTLRILRSAYIVAMCAACSSMLAVVVFNIAR